MWGLAFSAWPAAEDGDTDPACAVGLPCLVLATGLNDGQIKVWEVQTGEQPSLLWLQAACPLVPLWKEIPSPSFPNPCPVPSRAARGALPHSPWADDTEHSSFPQGTSCSASWDTRTWSGT